MADRRRPVLANARSKPAGQDVVLYVSKVASISFAGAPAVGQEPTFAMGSFEEAQFTPSRDNQNPHRH